MRSRTWVQRFSAASCSARVAVHLNRLDRDFRGIVALEPGCVDHDAADHAGHAESHDRLVVPGFAPASGLPAVVELSPVPERGRLKTRRAWADQVVLLGECLVV